MAPSTLSEVLNARQGLSRHKAYIIAQQLDYSEVERDYFVTLVELKDARSKKIRELAQSRLKRMKSSHEMKLNMKQWELISKWYFPAILELTKVEEFQSDVNWISKRLGLPKSECDQAINSMKELSLLKVSDAGKLHAKKALTCSPDGIPSKCTKKVHHDILQKALYGLYSFPVEKRNYNAMLMSVDSKLIPKAKTMIQQFNRELNKLLTSSKKRDQLFCFSSQLFSLENEKT